MAGILDTTGSAPPGQNGLEGILSWLRSMHSLPPSPEAPQGPPPQGVPPPQADAILRALLSNVIGAGSIPIQRTGQSALMPTSVNVPPLIRG